MAGTIFGSNGLLLASSQEYKEQIANELFRLISIGSAPILSRTLATPPIPQSIDSYYIVPAGATGAWVGKTNQIACPVIGLNGLPTGTWKFWQPFTGLTVFSVSGEIIFFDGIDWRTSVAGGDMLIADYGGSSFGTVARADEIVGNPSNDTFYGKESGNKGFFGFFSKVLSTSLTALNITTGGAITATDTLLIALGKIQNQINSININLSGNILTTVLTGLSTATGGAITATDTLLIALGKIQNQINDNTEQYSGDIESPIVQTYPLDFALLKGYNILSFSAVSESGTATISVSINGINISGLNNLSITSTRLTVPVTTGNLLDIGDRLELVVSAVNNPKHLFFTIGRKYV
jgi:hypothetical protein